MKTNITIYIISFIIFLAYSFSLYKWGESNERVKYISQIDTLVTYQTIRDTVKVPKFYEVVYFDTVKLTDTLLVEEKINYIAQVDTVYEDDLTHLKVEYISGIPLSKKSYFNLDLKVKKETVFIPTYKEYRGDTWGIGFGVSAHIQDSLKVNLFGNISYKIMNYRHFELPITAEIEFNDDLRISNKTIKAEGRLKF